MIKLNLSHHHKTMLFQDVVKFEYDKTMARVLKEFHKFQDVVKFEYDKTSVAEYHTKYMFQDVVKFEYDKT